MIERFQSIADMETRKSILLLAFHFPHRSCGRFCTRSVREGSAQISDFALSAMEINRGDGQLQARIDDALRNRIK